MADRIAIALSSNIVSPLGLTSSDNYSSVKAGYTGLKRHETYCDVMEPFVAALTNRGVILNECDHEGIQGDYTYFEKMVILSISKALKDTSIDVTSPSVLLMLSTIKGNIDLLRANEDNVPDRRVLLSESANAIAKYFGNPNIPVVVSNACVSGASAQIQAVRLIEAGIYESVVVCGADVVSPFVVEGFLSLKALTDEPCRPFDEDRTGINLGEAAATIVYHRALHDYTATARWYMAEGAVCNDAYHISSPSPTGEGGRRVLQSVLKKTATDDVAFVNAHGTATMFNDEMEAVAISEAGLSHTPVNSLKGYYGHTMGAAGVLEAIISMNAVDDGIILSTRGFYNLGVSRKINVTFQNISADKQAFIKMISGFGGTNAAILFKKTDKREVR